VNWKLRGRRHEASRHDRAGGVQGVCRAGANPTKKEAEHIFDVAIACIEATLLENLGTDGFTIKLNSPGKFSVRHKRGVLRKIPFTGEVKQIGQL
jgi:nucleoid DNA-binding protein